MPSIAPAASSLPLPLPFSDIIPICMSWLSVSPVPPFAASVVPMLSRRQSPFRSLNLRVFGNSLPESSSWKSMPWPSAGTANVRKSATPTRRFIFVLLVRDCPARMGVIGIPVLKSVGEVRSIPASSDWPVHRLRSHFSPNHPHVRRLAASRPARAAPARALPEGAANVPCPAAARRDSEGEKIAPVARESTAAGAVRGTPRTRTCSRMMAVSGKNWRGQEWLVSGRRTASAALALTFKLILLWRGGLLLARISHPGGREGEPGPIGARHRRGDGESQDETGALAGGALETEIAAVRQSNLAHQGQTQTGAAGLRRKERLEDSRLQ